MKEKKHVISRVIPGSIAEELELEPGDILTAINAQPVEDVFDYRYLMNDEFVTLTVEKAGGELWELEVEKEYEEDLGVEFENGLMDEYRSCSNRCIFCFIDQMPPGMRETLYFKDDDSRLSFLQGNYVTLTNMSQEDIDRIIKYRLEPINISFQTMNPRLRCEMLHNRFAGDALKKADRFYEAGISMNGQIVLCKGINDGKELEYSLEKLRNVTRPTIAGIMGAFGAALAARDLHLDKSSILTAEDLKTFSHTARPVTCNLCTNHCSLTVNTFDGGRRFISGNRCSRPLGKERTENPDLMNYKYKKLRALHGKGNGSGVRGKMGIPFGLNMYENLPFWFEFFTRLNFEVVLSPESSRKLYLKGQHTIPSDTVCYPAKLLHGHVEALVEEGVDAIWYPCMSYNNDEGIGDNHYNCPVVAYYPELLAANVPMLKQTKFLNPYVGLWRHKDFAKRIAVIMEQEFNVPKRETEAAAKAAYAAYDAYLHDVRETGKRYIEYARAHDMPIIVACGRPYHIDPEINHGINDLITSFGFVLVTEDALSYLEGYAPRKVLNQWTFQSRMYNAARYVCTQPDMQVVQLVSFGCGTDAITTDEMRDILESGGKLYTQLKIDDISNLGAVTIRIRSLMAAMDARKHQD